MKKLKGQVAVITGAGRGIGKAIALAFGQEGAAVICAARTKSEIEQTASHIQRLGGQSVAKTTDVTEIHSVESLFDFAHQTFHGVDIVVINAGISVSKSSVENSDPALWKRDINTNLIGAYHTAKASIPHLQARSGGKIILIGSGLGHRGVPERSAYACSKAGLWMLTRILAQELAPSQISVNELIPGPVQTELTPENNDQVRQQLGDGEWIKQPEDIVPLALFLASHPKMGPTAQSFSLMRRDG